MMSSGNAERMQDQCAGETGAVLAGGAMDHQRRAVFQQMRKQRAVTLRVVLDIAAVGLAHHLDGMVGRQRRAGGRDRAQRRDHGGFDRQRMDGDFRHAAQGGGALLGAAKVERAADAELPQHGDIVIGEMAEMVGAEDLPPAHGPAVARGIAAEIAEIAGAGEIEMAGGGG